MYYHSKTQSVNLNLYEAWVYFVLVFGRLDCNCTLIWF